MTLTGTDKTKPLTINGTNGEIYLSIEQSKEGNFLKVYTSNVKINDGSGTISYTVNDSTDNNGTVENKNGWHFYKIVELNNSLAKVNAKKIYIIFNDDFPANEFDVNTSLSIKYGTETETISSTGKPSRIYAKTWIFNLDKALPIEAILDNTAKLELKYYAETKEKDHISDIGLSVIDTVLASNSKVIRVFDGNQSLPILNTTILSSSKAKDINKFALCFSSDISKFWIPSISDDFNKSAKTIEGISENSDYTLISTGDVDTSKMTKKFKVLETDPHFVNANMAEFIYLYDGWLPCARLAEDIDIFVATGEDQAKINFDVWKFIFESVKHQRGGVSIFNNVVNPSKNEEVSIQVKMKSNGTLTIQIMTLDGSIVRTIERANKNAGAHLYHWDGKNNLEK